MWSVGTILTGLYSFMLETGPTLGSIATSMAQKRRFALKSLEFNVQNSMFVDLFPDYVELEKERRKLMPVGQGPARSVDLLHSQSTNLEDMNGLYTAVAGVFAVISLFFAYRFL